MVRESKISYVDIDPLESKKLMEQGYIYLDVRTEEEFEEGHPKDSYNVPVFFFTDEGKVLNSDFIPVLEANFSKEQGFVVGCRSGNRSQDAIQLMIEAGFKNIKHCYAGYNGKSLNGIKVLKGWLDYDLPVETGQPEKRSYKHLYFNLKQKRS